VSALGQNTTLAEYVFIPRHDQVVQLHQ